MEKGRYSLPCFFRNLLEYSNRGCHEQIASAKQRKNQISGIALALMFAGGGILLRLYHLQTTQYANWTYLANRQQHSVIQIQGARGTVFDAMGRTLAVSVPAISLGANPKDIVDLDSTSSKMTAILKISQDELKKKLQQRKTFTWLARGLPLEVSQQISELKLEGITEVNEFRRYYPQGTLASPILGRVERDGQGQSGIELQFEKKLLATSIQLPVKRDAKGRFVTEFALNGERATGNEDMQEFGFFDLDRKIPYMFRQAGIRQENINISSSSPESIFRREGSSIVLTIDILLQNILEEEFDSSRDESKAKKVFGLLMDVDTGDILSLAQSPRFDPNQFEHVSPDDLRNVVLQDSFEPGSTLKPLVASIALHQSAVHLEDRIDCEMGSYQVGSHVIRDVHPSGVLPLKDVLIRSSNICMAKIGQRLGKRRLAQGFREFGLSFPSGVELPGEAAGIIQKGETWREIDVATHAFGQGLAVTALQLVRAYAAIANGGILVKPVLIKSDGDERPFGRRILREDVANQMANILYGVTEDAHGTGREAAIAGFHVGGKTGTAQKPKAHGRGYDPDRVLASFIGFIDGNERSIPRRLILLVAVDEPGVKPRWGGVVAAPVFRRVMEKVLTQLLSSERAGVRTASVADIPSAATIRAFM